VDSYELRLQEKQTEILRKNNSLIALRERAEELGLNAKAIARAAEERMAEIREQKNILARVLLAIDNLYRRAQTGTLIKRQGMQPALEARKPDDMKTMLTVVGDYIGDLTDIVEGRRRLLSRE